MGDAARATIAAHGALGLYKGVASPLVGMGIFNAVQFAVFGAAKRAFTDDGKNVTLNRIAAAAGFTGVFVAFVEGPQDLFKCQMQAQMSGAAGAGAPAYKSTADCARTIMRERGAVAGPLQGIGATILRNVVGVTAYFYVYEYARMKMAGPGQPVESLSPLQVLLAGGLGGVGYWVTCYPLDIVKTAIQCDSIYPDKRKYAGTADAAAKLWAEGGAKRFTAGLSPALARSFPANAAGFAIYEGVKAAVEGK
jgi:solute carrier family 25 carnitine/acylcarnitine transporter 20/29